MCMLCMLGDLYSDVDIVVVLVVLDGKIEMDVLIVYL